MQLLLTFQPPLGQHLSEHEGLRPISSHIVAEFIKILDDYVDSHYAAKQQLVGIN